MRITIDCQIFYVQLVHISLFQYSVYQPLAFSTAWMRLSILSINPFKTPSPMLHHILFSRLWSSSLTPFPEPWRYIVSGNLRYNSALRMDQRFSIGFKSGELAGKSMIVNPCSSAAAWSQFIVAWAWWEEALSYWKITLLIPISWRRSTNDRRFCSSIWM